MCQRYILNIHTGEVESRHARHFVHHHSSDHRACGLITTSDYFAEDCTWTNRDDFGAKLVWFLHFLLEIPSGSFCQSFTLNVRTKVSSNNIWPRVFVIRFELIIRRNMRDSCDTWSYYNPFDLVLLSCLDCKSNTIYCWFYHIIMITRVWKSDRRCRVNNIITAFNCVF